MCQYYDQSSSDNYQAATRKIRIHGHSTSVRLENIFWTILECMAQAEGKSIGRMLTILYDQIRQSDENLSNFTSCLRVMALRYGISHGQQCEKAQGTRNELFPA